MLKVFFKVPESITPVCTCLYQVALVYTAFWFIWIFVLALYLDFLCRNIQTLLLNMEFNTFLSFSFLLAVVFRIMLRSMLHIFRVVWARWGIYTLLQLITPTETERFLPSVQQVILENPLPLCGLHQIS